MRPVRSWTATVLSLGLTAPVASAAIVTNTSGVYDENVVQANVVDATATTPTTGSPTLLSLSTLSNDIVTAFAAGTGGVINFDDVTTATSNQTVINAKYGAGFASTLNVTGTAYQVDMSQLTTIGATPISGSVYLRNGASNGIQGYAFDQLLKEVGITVLARNGARSITATVTYNDATTASIGPVSIASFTGTPPQDGSTPDTFFGFAAPSGKSITALTLSGGSNNFYVVDDLAFITVPEPGAAGLLGLAGLGLLRRRKHVAQ